MKWSFIKTPTKEIFDNALKILEQEGFKNDGDGILWDTSIFQDGTGVIYYGELGLAADDGYYLTYRPGNCTERKLCYIPEEMFKL